MKKTLIPVFPGTNCEKESLLWIKNNLETSAEYLNLEKHNALSAEEIDLILIPGGFSYGDYLRAGAIAAQSEEMKFISRLSHKNVPILGICNGFQILCETHLLPGVLVKNITRQHHHFPVSLKLNMDYLKEEETKKTVWLPKLSKEKYFKFEEKYNQFEIPMSCGMGNWRPPLEDDKKQNCEKNAILYYEKNENGSYKAIAGLINSAGNVLGMMPHPERASDEVLGSCDGLLFLYGLAENTKIKIKEGSELWKFAMNF